MEKEELNKCLRKFYMAAGKHDGSYYNKATVNITFISPRIYKGSCIANFSEKEKTKKKKINK